MYQGIKPEFRRHNQELHLKYTKRFTSTFSCRKPQLNPEPLQTDMHSHFIDIGFQQTANTEIKSLFPRIFNSKTNTIWWTILWRSEPAVFPIATVCIIPFHFRVSILTLLLNHYPGSADVFTMCLCSRYLQVLACRELSEARYSPVTKPECMIPPYIV